MTTSETLPHVTTPIGPNKKLCNCSIAKPGQTNLIPGMVFVGWGLGWQACITCNGAGTLPVLGEDGHDAGDE